jgi:hypothetical protein
MAFARVLVQMLNDTALPKDMAVNTWHFRTPGSVADASATINANLDTFYTALSTYYSPVLTGTCTTKYYDLEDNEPRAPVAESSFVMGTLGSSGLPNEVAVCMSYQAPIVSGTPQARRRGRLFLGPLSTNITSSSTGDQRPSSGARTAIAAAADALMSDTTLPGLIWSVFSPSTAGTPPWSAATLGDAFETITNGWINDAFDTMRSRGLAPTARTTWS